MFVSSRGDVRNQSFSWVSALSIRIQVLIKFGKSLLGGLVGNMTLFLKNRRRTACLQQLLSVLKDNLF